MKPTFFLFILSFLISPFFSNGQNATTILLEGKIGKASIVMEITINNKDVWAQYYYKRFKKTIPLEAKYITDKTIELTYEHWDSKETFLLKDITTGTTTMYSGTWKQEINEGEKTIVKEPLPVKLTKLNVSKIPVRNTYVQHANLSEYDYSILADIKIIEDSIQKINSEFSLTWLSDSISGFSSFRINKQAGASGLDSINTFLEQLQFSEISSYLDCGSGEYTSDISSVYVRGHILSFALSNSYDCGGAHPDFGTTGYTFNLETGTQLELSDFLYFGKTEADYPKGDSYKFKDEIMAPNIVKILTKLYPDEMKKPDDEDEPCDYSTPEVWEYTSWYLTKDGLYLYPYFARVARCCDGPDFSTIPYSTLTKYKNLKVRIPIQY